MAQYEIKMSCGHTETHNICGPGRDRDRIAEKIGRGVCSECAKAQKAEFAASQTSKWSLPQLTGSDKQIAWAEQIRAKALTGVYSMVHGKSAQMTDKTCDALCHHLGSMSSTEAKWWIDNRDSGWRTHFGPIWEQAGLAAGITR